MIEIGRAGVSFRTAAPVLVGSQLGLRLVYRTDAVDLRATVRWCRHSVAPGKQTERPWAVGIAFTHVGEVSADGIWRTLAVYGEDSSDESE